MQDSDSVYFVGVVAAAAAVGQPPAKIQRLILDGFLQTRRGGSTPRGGRPAHLIARQDLINALARYDAWEKEKPRPKPPPPPAPRPAIKRTKMTRRRRKKLKKMHKFLWGFGRRPRGYAKSR